jgi:hypothetical protein
MTNKMLEFRIYDPEYQDPDKIKTFYKYFRRIESSDVGEIPTEMLNSDGPSPLSAVVWTFGEIGGLGAESHPLRLLDDDNLRCRPLAAEALEKLGRRSQSC